jgi:hypothetical protein
MQVEGKAGKGKGKSTTINKKQKGNREDYSGKTIQKKGAFWRFFG